MKRTSILLFLLGVAVLSALVSCRKKGEPDNYLFEDAVTADSVVVSVGEAINAEGAQTATVRIHLFIDNNVDTVNAENHHIIDKIFITARIGGLDREYVLATDNNQYEHNSRIRIGDYDNVLVSKFENLSDGYDQQIGIVFTGADFLRDDVEFVIIGFDQNLNATDPLYVNKNGNIQHKPFYVVDETPEIGNLF